MISDIQKFNLYLLAVHYWGENSQVHLAIEELNELAVELSHAMREIKKLDKDKLAYEITDVYIMLEQMENIFGLDKPSMRVRKQLKLERLAKLLDAEKRRLEHD